MANPVQNHQFHRLDHEESCVNGSVMGPQIPAVSKGVDRSNLINRQAMCREQFYCSLYKFDAFGRWWFRTNHVTRKRTLGIDWDLSFNFNIC